MTKLCLILGDQLSLELSSLKCIKKKVDLILMCEVAVEASYVPHHPQKIALIFAAMRHFAKLLQSEGYRIRYVTLDDPQNTGHFFGEVERAIHERACSEVFMTEPGEWRLAEAFQQWQSRLGKPVTIIKDDRFLCSIDEFKTWAKNKKQLRMEYFYREMRNKHQILLEKNGTPCGGKWNYDSQNRKKLNPSIKLPPRNPPKIDELTKKTIELVAERFGHHFGNLAAFDFAVDRENAYQEALYFIEHYLPYFGDFQDAMATNQPYLFHSRLSAYINIGLLLPLELCQLAEKAYKNNAAPLNAVEGFIRQIMGWREYIRGVYWLKMPEYAKQNYFNAVRPLPNFYWGAPTDLFCVSEAVRHTKEFAYSHHIQRLMITGNFALLAGILPEEVCTWYLAVYADAFEWVELPNTLGMALFADGGGMASKPYAASGKYINKMSDFCKSCSYDPKLTLGDKACPFNSLYWNFLLTHREKLQKNPRLAFAYQYLDKLDSTQENAIRNQASNFLDSLESTY